MERLQYWFSGVLSLVGGACSYYIGDITPMVVCLFGFITMDYITGLLVAISTRTLSSEIGFKGICKKVFIILLIGIGNLLDINLSLGGACRGMLCVFYIANEGISILENGSKLGLPIPKPIQKLLHNMQSDAEQIDLIDDNGGDDNDI